MEVTPALVQQLAQLSKLYFTPDEMIQVQQDLSQMIAFVDQLSAVDTNGVAPLLFMNENVQPYRADVPTESIATSEALKNAPMHDGTYVLVPKVIQK